ncbi:MAG: hypothetical protein HQL28_05645 [Candidatus Omnitrophica bacterium]|nr:hypothetical protein [Candidatus Omnitrophota bacterium]
MRFLKTLVGVLLIPLAIGVAKAFYGEISDVGEHNTFLMMEHGVVSYALFHLLVMRPVYIYVLGHEFVHVLSTWVCGGRVESFRVTPQGGSVVTSKTNIFIELSPYFVPIYTMLLAPLFGILRLVYGDVADFNSTLLFLVGLTLAFHFIMTTEVLKMEQSDIAKSGAMLSLIFIFICNLVVIMAVFCPIFHSLSFAEFIKKSAFHSRDLYVGIYDRGAAGWEYLAEKLNISQ